MGIEKMNHPHWTDEFLDQKRQIGDVEYDKYIRAILDQSYFEDYHEIFAGWVKSQSDQITEAKRILSSWTGDTRHSPETIRAIDSLGDLQIEQHAITDRWTMHLWPQDFHFHIQSARLATLNACKALANYEVRTALAAMESALTNGTILIENLDKLSADIHSNSDLNQQLSEKNRYAYNRFLQAVEAIRMNPGIFLWGHSFRKIQFESYPIGLNNNFRPAMCPLWVDEEKLKLGVQIWDRHMVECLLVLFAHSLPACYLDRKGIPMLYETHRLDRQEFLAQRIYETGFMLHDVMKKGGLVILQEQIAGRIAWLAVAVRKTHPDWRFQFGRYLEPEWHGPTGGIRSYSEVLADPAVKQEFEDLEKQGATAASYSPGDLGAQGHEQLFRNCLDGVQNPRQNYLLGRCLWGPGFLAATKIRYFHAEMRYRTLQADPPFNVSENGFPINQEDLAYTLLTFGYLIPKGMEHLGAVVSREKKEAILHCWRVVGYIMGIDEDLLTDDWDQAKALYEKIKNRQQGPSPNGMKLTGALCAFLTDQLPTWFPYRSVIPAVWIRDQLGADADDLFDPANKAASHNLAVRVCWAIVKHVFLRCYFLTRHMWNHWQATQEATSLEIQFLGETLLTSLHQTFERQRFDLTAGLKGFTPYANVTAAEHEKRHDIRRKVVLWVLTGFGLMVIFHFIFWIGVAGYVVWEFSAIGWTGTLAKVMFGLLLLNQTSLSLIMRKLKRYLKTLTFDTGPKL